MTAKPEKLPVSEKAIERGLGPMLVTTRIELISEQLKAIRETGLTFDESLYGQKLPEGMSQSLDVLIGAVNRLPVLAEMLEQIRDEMRIDYDTGIVSHSSWDAC